MEWNAMEWNEINIGLVARYVSGMVNFSSTKGGSIDLKPSELRDFAKFINFVASNVEADIAKTKIETRVVTVVERGDRRFYLDGQYNEELVRSLGDRELRNRSFLSEDIPW